jgi:RNA polymerase sigma-70 factor, ECF subfamily
MRGSWPSDGELVVRVRGGDREAFEGLVRRHLRPALRLAARLLGDEDAAEDVVQESFMAALDGLDGFDTKRAFGPWFYRIVANRCSNARRTSERRRTGALTPTLESREAGPERALERAELGMRLRAALERLPSRQREVLLLYEVEGFTGGEIAELLGVTQGTVRWHLHQARASMRAALEGERGSGGT